MCNDLCFLTCFGNLSELIPPILIVTNKLFSVCSPMFIYFKTLLCLLYFVNRPCIDGLSFIAVSLNLCLYLKSYSITVDYVNIVGRRFNKMAEDNQKDLLSAEIDIKQFAFGSPLPRCSCHKPELF